MKSRKYKGQSETKVLLKAKAIYLGERIETRALETTSLLATTPLIFEVNDSSYAVVFKYGVIVLVDVNPLNEVDFLSKIQDLVKKKIDTPETDEVEIELAEDIPEGMRGNKIVIREPDIYRLQLIAEILAKNVILGYYETKVAQNFDQIEPIAESMQEKSKLALNARALVKHIGGGLLNLHKMVGRVEVSEKPELLWEHPELERFYARLEDEYEIKERHIAIERKIELISRTAQTVLDLLQTKRSLRVEWYIVILIVIEILITIYELFLRH